LVELFKTRS